MRVLLIDDNALTRYTIKSLLEKLGHEVVAEAEDGPGALKYFGELKPDVVFLDLILPGMSGEEILAALRVTNPAVRVVVVTAVAQDELDRRLTGKGVSFILRKPFSFDAFRVLMKELTEA